MGEPPNTSLISIVSSLASMARTSFADKRISVAPMFSFRRQRQRVPGIGTIHGRLFIIHASEICEAVARCSSANRSSRANRTVLHETVPAVLRHRGTVVGCRVKRSFGCITVAQQSVGKRRECDEAHAQLFEHGEQLLMPPRHHRIAVLYGRDGTDLVGTAQIFFGRFRYAPVQDFSLPDKVCHYTATASGSIAGSIRCW